MDLAAILAKLTGAALLIWTLRSIYKHFFVQAKNRVAVSSSAGQSGSIAVSDKKQSLSEAFLNNLLLYLWLAFMLAFSTGMIFNN
jgi:predicted permease